MEITEEILGKRTLIVATKSEASDKNIQLQPKSAGRLKL